MFRVVSIGTMAAHPLWGESSPVRTGHGTTTLIQRDDVRILVDPSLPGEILAPRLAERTGLTPDAITHVFLTSFNPELRRGLTSFADATWWIGATEREAVGVPLAGSLRLAMESANEDAVRALESEVAILHRCEAAPDHLAEAVDLFPLPGVTPGLCGVLIADTVHTTLVCGDAIPTLEHLEQGKVLQTAADLELARESFSEAVEIADLLILGRDNISANPTKRGF